LPEAGLLLREEVEKAFSGARPMYAMRCGFSGREAGIAP